jgi:hypothetical protein
MISHANMELLGMQIKNLWKTDVWAVNLYIKSTELNKDSNILNQGTKQFWIIIHTFNGKSKNTKS